MNRWKDENGIIHSWWDDHDWGVTRYTHCGEDITKKTLGHSLYHARLTMPKGFEPPRCDLEESVTCVGCAAEGETNGS